MGSLHKMRFQTTNYFTYKPVSTTPPEVQQSPLKHDGLFENGIFSEPFVLFLQDVAPLNFFLGAKVRTRAWRFST